MRYSICRIDDGDRMSYHKSYEAALKSLTKLRRSIVLRDEIVVEIWSTCREPVELLILKQALDNINLSDEDKAYVDNVLAKGKGQGR